MLFGWTIRDHKCVELVGCFQLHYACFVWSLIYGDINFRSFKEKINRKCVTVARCYSTGMLQCPWWPLYPLLRPLGAIHSCSYSGKERKRGEKRKERREERSWEKLGFSPMDRCRFHSTSKIIRVRSFFSFLFLWEIDARVCQFLWIN